MSVKTKQEKNDKIRHCIGCGILRPKHEMLRVVRDVNGNIKLDKTGKLNGRGSYICYDFACYEKAIKKKCFSRSLKINALPTQLKDEISAEIYCK